MLPSPIRASLRAGVLATILAVYGLLAWRFWFSVDAAWIDARYARNLAEGLGPVFNPGDPPLEAWSSLGMVLLGAALNGAGLEAMPALQLVALVAGGLLLLALHRFLEARDTHPVLAAGAVGSLALMPTLGAWTSGLPSAIPGVLAVFLLFDRLVRGRGRTGAVQAVLATVVLGLMRPDGLFWAAAMVLLVAPWHLAAQRRRDAPLPRSARPGPGPWLQPVAAAAVTALGLAGALGAWRVLTFGDPLPWTLRQGLPLALGDGLRTLGGTTVGLGLPFLWFGLGSWSAWRRRGELPTLALLGVGALAVVLGGANSEPFGRVLLPAAVFGTLVVARFADEERRLGHPGTALGVVALAGLLAVVPVFDVPLAPRRVRQATDLRPDTARTRTEMAQWRFTRANTREGLRLGREVRRVLGPDHTWTVGSPGARGFTSHMTLLDLSGATSPEAWAARQGDRAPRTVFAHRQPDLLRARLVDDAGVARVLAADWAVAHPDYTARRVDLGEGAWLVVQEHVRLGVTPSP